MDIEPADLGCGMILLSKHDIYHLCKVAVSERMKFGGSHGSFKFTDWRFHRTLLSTNELSVMGS